jgi:hypothetical protein
MSVEEIESAIAQLPDSEIARLAEWFQEFQARAWDAQIERDMGAGRLDALIEQAEREFESGECDSL